MMTPLLLLMLLMLSLCSKHTHTDTNGKVATAFATTAAVGGRRFRRENGTNKQMNGRTRTDLWMDEKSATSFRLGGTVRHSLLGVGTLWPASRIPHLSIRAVVIVSIDNNGQFRMEYGHDNRRLTHCSSTSISSTRRGV